MWRDDRHKMAFGWKSIAGGICRSRLRAQEILKFGNQIPLFQLRSPRAVRLRCLYKEIPCLGISQPVRNSLPPCFDRDRCITD